MATQVIHIRNAPVGWESDPAYMYIGRGRNGKWGNPFSVAKYGREKCLDLHAEYLKDHPELLEALSELKNKTLVCYCRVDDRPERVCHGDTLAFMADEENQN